MSQIASSHLASKLDMRIREYGLSKNHQVDTAYDYCGITPQPQVVKLGNNFLRKIFRNTLDGVRRHQETEPASQLTFLPTLMLRSH